MVNGWPTPGRSPAADQACWAVDGRPAPGLPAGTAPGRLWLIPVARSAPFPPAFVPAAARVPDRGPPHSFDACRRGLSNRLRIVYQAVTILLSRYFASSDQFGGPHICDLWAIHLSGPDKNRPLDAVVMAAWRTKILRLVRLTEYPYVILFPKRIPPATHCYCPATSRSCSVQQVLGVLVLDRVHQGRHTVDQWDYSDICFCLAEVFMSP
jgi:hypothetical protein